MTIFLVLIRQFIFLRKMDKVFEFNPKDVKDSRFEITFDDDEPWKPKGLLGQMKRPYWGCEKKKSTVPVFDVGDYSIFIKKNLEDAEGFFIRTKSSKWYEAKEIMPSPSGSVLYFDEQVGEIFKKGCIYPVVIFSPYVFTYKKIMRAAIDIFKPNQVKAIGYGRKNKILSP